MNQRFDFGKDQSNGLVYVSPVAADDLPQDVRQQLGDALVIYSVNRADGERLALVKDREMAFALARHHDFIPVSVH